MPVALTCSQCGVIIDLGLIPPRVEDYLPAWHSAKLLFTKDNRKYQKAQVNSVTPAANTDLH